MKLLLTIWLERDLMFVQLNDPMIRLCLKGEVEGGF